MIENDFQSALKKRKQLSESRKGEKGRKQEGVLYLVHNKHKIDKESLVWNATENERVEVFHYSSKQTKP